MRLIRITQQQSFNFVLSCLVLGLKVICSSKNEHLLGFSDLVC